MTQRSVQQRTPESLREKAECVYDSISLIVSFSDPIVLAQMESSHALALPDGPSDIGDFPLSKDALGAHQIRNIDLECCLEVACGARCFGEENRWRAGHYDFWGRLRFLLRTWEWCPVGRCADRKADGGLIPHSARWEW